MAIREYLAMTAAEIRGQRVLPEALGWLACHFSPYGRGLSNLPPSLPPGALVIVDDITPIRGHDPEEIAAQLNQCAEKLQCRQILLDFQRPGDPQAKALAEHLCRVLSFPVGVSEDYAPAEGPVFLPPVPCHVALEDHLAPWAGREIWLDSGAEGAAVTVTERGTIWESLPSFPETGFRDEALHCHYQIQEEKNALKFFLWRTKDDKKTLLKEAQSLGVQTAIGLWQEMF